MVSKDTCNRSGPTGIPVGKAWFEMRNRYLKEAPGAYSLTHSPPGLPSFHGVEAEDVRGLAFSKE